MGTHTQNTQKKKNTHTPQKKTIDSNNQILQTAVKIFTTYKINPTPLNVNYI